MVCERVNNPDVLLRRLWKRFDNIVVFPGQLFALNRLPASGVFMTTATHMVESLKAASSLPSTIQFCSLDRGWHSVLLRHYVHKEEVELFESAPLPAHNVVLVVKGSTRIESFANGIWRSGHHVPGSLAMTAPETGTHLRWRGPQKHETLHLVMPAKIMNAARIELGDGSSGFRAIPNALSIPDPLVVSTLRSLQRAALGGVPDLYAESGAHFPAIHLLAQRAPNRRRVLEGGETKRLGRVEEYMLAHLSKPVTLDELADKAGCSSFRLIRLCRLYWGETPFRRLTRLRMEHGQKLLRATRCQRDQYFARVRIQQPIPLRDGF